MKQKIFCITPNPALDLSGVVDNLEPNEKAYVHDEQRAPGGNAINAARILNRLNVPVIASGFLGGSTGDEIMALLAKEHLNSDFVNIAATTRINVTVSDRHSHQQTRLSFPGPKIKVTEKAQLWQRIERNQGISLIVIGGSMPEGFSSKDLSRWILRSAKRGLPTVIDCPGKILAEVLHAKPFFIKPNIEEFHELTGSKVRSIESVKRRAEQLLDWVPSVCISSVAGGALFVTRQGACFGKIPPIEIRSTVGAGDSMVGAMVAQFAQGEKSPEVILRWGLAAAAATLQETGTKLGSAKEIRRLYQLTKVSPV